MKTLYFYVFFVSIVSYGIAQKKVNNSLVTREARHVIHTYYPKVKDFKWYDYGQYYKVNFIDEKGENKNLKITKEGIILYSQADLPISIMSKLKEEKVKGIENVEKINSKEYGTLYKIRTSNKIYFYTKSGKRILTLCKSN